MSWEYIAVAPFCGFSAYGQRFHFTESSAMTKESGDMSNNALITIISGDATARQIENEFKATAGPQSTWRWYAKKLRKICSK